MKLLHNSIYFSIEWNEEKSLFHYIFNASTAQMTKEQYIDELKTFITLVKSYRPKKVFGDMSNFMFTISPDVQEWVNENLFPVYASIGFKKIAIMLSSDLFAHISIQQTMDEDSTSSFETRYFDNQAEAYQWLDLA
jgi:hypothetical protein